jgi:hypothetical protein
VEFLDESFMLFSAGQDVDSFSRGVDDGRRSDSDFGRDEGTEDVLLRRDGDAVLRIDEAGLPQGRVAGAIGVEGVDGVVLGGREDDVALPCSWEL